MAEPAPMGILSAQNAIAEALSRGRESDADWDWRTWLIINLINDY